MKINYPLAKRLWQRLRLGKVVDLDSYANAIQTLCPSEKVLAPAAIYPKGSLEKITKLSPWRSWNGERSLWEGGEVTHGATLAFEIPNVDLVSSYLYTGAAKRQVGYGAQQLFLPSGKRREELGNAKLVTSLSGAQFFGTLLVDDFPLGLIAEGDPNNVSVKSDPGLHELGYREIFDLPSAPSKEIATIGVLTVYQDFAQNSFKAERYRILRSRIRTKFESERIPPTGVYIRRGAGMGESRQLENEDEIELLLASHGFDIIDPATMGAAEITRRVYGAKIVAGVEGSQLSHGVFAAAENAAFLVFQPPWRFAMSYKEFVDCLEMRFAFVVGDTSPKGFVLKTSDVEDSILKLN